MLRVFWNGFQVSNENEWSANLVYDNIFGILEQLDFGPKLYKISIRLCFNQLCCSAGYGNYLAEKMADNELSRIPSPSGDWKCQENMLKPEYKDLKNWYKVELEDLRIDIILNQREKTVEFKTETEITPEDLKSILYNASIDSYEIVVEVYKKEHEDFVLDKCVECFKIGDIYFICESSVNKFN